MPMDLQYLLDLEEIKQLRWLLVGAWNIGPDDLATCSPRTAGSTSGRGVG
jgi:hypothetical protein